MTTSHEPAYPEDGMPKERYAAYHTERAKAGVALTMTAGSAAVSKDSPPVFNNILAYRDEVMPWIQQLTDGVHEHDCAVMIQLTHLGRRTGWNKGNWLPSVSSSKHREPAHRAFPKLIEDWDIERIITDFADAAARMQAGGMDGTELQVYGHLLDQFWSPLTNDLVGPYGADTLENRLRFPMDVLDAIRKRVGDEFIVGLRYAADEAANVVTSWDIISGDVKLADNVLIYDESGDHPGLQAAEIAAQSGAKVEIMTPDRVFAPDIMAMNLVPYMRELQARDVTFTVTRRLLDVARDGNKLIATIGTDYSDHTHTAQYDQVVMNYGTLPLDELYFDLRDQSSNVGAVDHDALIAGQPQTLVRNPDGRFQLFRIGRSIGAQYPCGDL